MAYRDDGVIKIMSVKYAGHRYYVQEMPGLWGCGRRYKVMCDRRVLCTTDWSHPDDAVEWLLRSLLRDVTAQVAIDIDMTL